MELLFFRLGSGQLGKKKQLAKMLLFGMRPCRVCGLCSANSGSENVGLG